MNTAQQVIAYVQRHGPASRAEVARQVRRSKPATSAAIDALLQRGLLAELGQGRASIGRPPMLLTLNSRYRLVAGAEVDVGQVRLGLGDLHGDLLHLETCSWTPGTLGDTLRRALDELAARHGQAPVHALALGLPGVIEGETGQFQMHYAPNLPELEGPGVLQELQRQVGGLPLLPHNDVNLAAVSEARAGELLAFVSIGSGFGVGITQGKALLGGHRGRAGELGYLPTPAGPPLETILSEAGLGSLLGLSAGQLLPLLGGRDPAVLRRAAARPFLDALLWALQVLTVTLDPARIVIGGRIGSKLFAHLPALQEGLSRTLPFAPHLSVSQHPDSDVVRGALQLAAERTSADLLAELGQRVSPTDANADPRAAELVVA